MNEFQTNFQLVIFLGPDIRRLFWIRVQIITLAQSFLVFMSNHKKYVLVFREINQFVTFWQQLRMQWTEHSQIAQHNSVTEPKPQHLNQIELVEILYRCCPEPWPESWLPYKYICQSITKLHPPITTLNFGFWILYSITTLYGVRLDGSF